MEKSWINLDSFSIFYDFFNLNEINGNKCESCEMEWMGIGKMLEPGFEHRTMRSQRRWQWKSIKIRKCKHGESNQGLAGLKKRSNKTNETIQKITPTGIELWVKRLQAHSVNQSNKWEFASAGIELWFVRYKARLKWN